MGCNSSDLKGICLRGSQPKQNLSNGSSSSVNKNSYETDIDTRLDYLLKLIISKESSILSEEFFDYLRNQISGFYWPLSTKRKLIKLLEEYIEATFTYQSMNNQEQNSEKINNFLGKFSKEILLIKQQIFAEGDNTQVFNFFIEIYKKQTSFSYKFGQQSIKEIYQISDFIIKNPSIPVEKQLFFLAFYLMMGCRYLERSGAKMNFIDEKLKQILNNLNQRYIDTPYKNVDDDIKFIFYGIREEKFRRIKNYKLDTGENLYKFIRLQGDTQKRERQLQEEILDIVKQAKKVKQFFASFLHKICDEKDGYNFKCCLKLESKLDVKAMERVKEKILFNKKQEKVKDNKLDYSTINELIEGEKVNNNLAIQRFLTDSNKLEIKISDILRGKCMFPSLQDVNQATERIIEEVELLSSKGEDIKIIEVENRLKGVTNDVVLKIKIKRVVGQFQLMFCQKKGLSTQNSIYHKMYEIGRSKTYSTIYMLFDWFQKVTKRFMASLNNEFFHENKSQESKQLFSELLQFLKVAQGRQIKQALKTHKVLQRISRNSKLLDKKKFNEMAKERTGDSFIMLNETNKALSVYNQILRNGQLSPEFRKRIVKKVNKLEAQDEISSEEGRQNIAFLSVIKVNKVYKSIIKVHH